MAAPNTPSLRKVSGRRELVENRMPLTPSQIIPRPPQMQRCHSDKPSQSSTRPIPLPVAPAPVQRSHSETKNRPPKPTAESAPTSSKTTADSSSRKEDKQPSQSHTRHIPLPVTPTPVLRSQSETTNRPLKPTAEIALPSLKSTAYSSSRKEDRQPSQSHTRPIPLPVTPAPVLRSHSETNNRPRKPTAESATTSSKTTPPSTSRKEDKQPSLPAPALPGSRPPNVRSQSESQAQVLRTKLNPPERPHSDPAHVRHHPPTTNGPPAVCPDSKALVLKPQSLLRDFPSAPMILEPLKAACLASDLDSISTLANAILTWIDESVNRIERRVDADALYLCAKASVQRLSQIFMSSVVALEQAPRPVEPSALEQAYLHAAETLDGLYILYHIGRLRLCHKKDLPPLPEDIDALLGPELMRPISHISFEDNDAEYLGIPSPDELAKGGKFKLVPFLPKSKKKDKKDSDGKSILSMESTQTAKASIKTFTNSLVPRPRKKSDDHRPETLFNQRNTILIFEDNFREVEIKFGWDIKAGEGAENPTTSGNQIKAGSLPMFIRLLTVDEGKPNVGLCHILLTSFRLFATPLEFFEELVRRYESAPTVEGPVAAGQVRSRVLAVVRCWLDQHWEAQHDTAVLWRISDFFKYLKETNKDGALETSINELISRVQELELYSAQDLFSRHLEAIKESSAAKTGRVKTLTVKFPAECPTSADGIVLLDNETGREVLARQLTMSMSALYRQLKPVDVVSHWYNAGESARSYGQFQGTPAVEELSEISSYGEKLTSWIITSMIEPESRKERVRAVKFWVDVAVRCMKHHNYATAHNIYASLEYSSVVRMKVTLLAVPQAIKIRYHRKVSNFFKEKTEFEKTFDDIRPSLPSTTPLLRGITQTNVRVDARLQGRKNLQSQTRPKGQVWDSDGRDVIMLEKIKAAEDARRVLNKALLEYGFPRDEHVANWLDRCINRFTLDIEEKKAAFYSDIHKLSVKREEKQDWMEIVKKSVWDITTTNLADPLRGDIKEIPATAFEASTQAVTKKLLSFLKNLLDF